MHSIEGRLVHCLFRADIVGFFPTVLGLSVLTTTSLLRRKRQCAVNIRFSIGASCTASVIARCVRIFCIKYAYYTSLPFKK